jgi:hypothetical protein
MEVLKPILEVAPRIIIEIARVLYRKLAEKGGITPQEEQLLQFLDFLEAFMRAKEA